MNKSYRYECGQEEILYLNMAKIPENTPMAETWDQDRIQKLIDDEVEERLTLEYKGKDSLGKSDGKKKEITKDVSAMANSDGGILIYGVSEYSDPEKKHRPEKIEPIDRREFSKEWLDQVIGNVRPPIDGLFIHPVTLDTDPNDTAYVVDIPKSTTAHQAKDLKYYKRYNFQVLAMENYQIQDVMARSKHPKIDLFFSVNSTYVEGPRMFVCAENKGQIYAKYVKCILQIPADCLNDPEAQSIGQLINEAGQTFWEVYTDNRQRDVMPLGYSLNPSGIAERTTTQGPSWFNPILPGNIRTLRFLTLSKDFPIYRGIRSKAIRWTVYADNAPPVQGEIALADIPEE